MCQPQDTSTNSDFHFKFMFPSTLSTCMKKGPSRRKEVEVIRKQCWVSREVFKYFLDLSAGPNQDEKYS